MQTIARSCRGLDLILQLTLDRLLFAGAICAGLTFGTWAVLMLSI